MEQEVKKSNNVGRIIAIVAVIATFILLIVGSSAVKESPADKAWDLETTVGNENAKNHYIMYTDLMCPYCDVFSREVMAHWDEFEQYLAENSILFEVRLTDALYLGSGSTMSRDSAEAAYCAKRENKFWDFYHGALASLWEDYHSKGIGNSKTATPIRDMPDDYWLKVGHGAGLGETFDNCVKNRETADEVYDNSVRALQVSEGMPTFQFGNFTTSGFSDTWDWSYVKRYLDAGLEK